MAQFAFFSKKSNTYESEKIINAAHSIYEEVKIVKNINKFAIKLHGGNVKVFYSGTEFRPDTFLVRSSKGEDEKLSAITKCLIECGVDVVDPQYRFKTVGGSKLETSIERYFQNLGPESYFAFNHEEAICLVDHLEFPIIAKPINGSHKKGFNKFNNMSDKVIDYIDNLYEENSDAILFMQTKEKRIREYRVVTYDDEIICAVRRLPKRDDETEERMEPVTDKVMEKLRHFIEEEIMPIGIYGFDIMKVKRGDEKRYVVIEANRAPQFKAVDRILNIDVGRLIVEKARSKVI